MDIPICQLQFLTKHNDLVAYVGIVLVKCFYKIAAQEHHIGV